MGYRGFIAYSGPYISPIRPVRTFSREFCVRYVTIPYSTSKPDKYRQASNHRPMCDIHHKINTFTPQHMEVPARLSADLG